MKKGRHRRFEEARALKRSGDLDVEGILGNVPSEPCPECGSDPGKPHASWCMHDELEDDD